jgi:signal transduction histidine kinase
VLLPIALMGAAFLGLTLVPASKQISVVVGALPLHTALEVFSICVSALIFAVGWNTRSGDRPRSLAILSVAFLGVALLDFEHVLSYPGMPDYVTVASVQKGTAFFLAARLLASVALLAAVIMPSAKQGSRRMDAVLLGGCLIGVALYSWVVLFRGEIMPTLFVPGVGVTLAKRAADYTTTVLSVITAIAVVLRAKRRSEYDPGSLVVALVAIALGALCLSAFKTTTDVFALAGHVYKVVAYLFLYKAVFVVAVREPYEQLDATNRVLRESQSALHAANESLAAANTELSAFAYSVSHDLRTPLRGIDGFSHALLEDYGDVVDEQGKDYLRRIRRATQQMGRLIDDMLKLSRLTRAEMRRTSVDISDMAKVAAGVLAAGQPDRHVDVHIEPGIIVDGDPELLRVVVENLVENAWKFSGRNPDAVIDVRSTVTGADEQAFLVQDNGVGFDMAYVGKLFGAFQRLHRSDEFPGTGVGLATVQRVVNRHGGRVWAEAAVDQGATFYVALPTTASEEEEEEAS